MTGPFTPWGTMPFKPADMATIDELQSVGGQSPRPYSPARSGSDEILATNSDPRGTSSLLADKDAGEAPPPASSVSPFPQGRAVRSGATAPAGAGDEPAPAFSSEGARLVPASFSLSHASRLLLRLVALHERISEGEALARAVAFFAAERIGLRSLADAAEDLRARREAGSGGHGRGPPVDRLTD